MKEFLIQARGLRRGPVAEPVAPAWVLVGDGRVIHAAGRPPAGVPEGTPRLQAGWLVEPLADAHVHLARSGALESGERARVARLPAEQALERVLGILAEHLRAGVAAVRDGGDPTGTVLQAAAIARRRPGQYTQVLPAGAAVTRRGFYGAFLGRAVEDVREACAVLTENAAAGASHAKILATGPNSLSRPGEVGPRPFSSAELRELAAAGRHLGLAVMMHANGPLAEVLDANPDSVEHGFWLAEGDSETMAAQGVAWTPTIAAWAELARKPDLTSSQRRVVEVTHRRHLLAVAAGRRHGVLLTAGSDAGTPGVDHRSGLLREGIRLREATLPAPEALAAATHGARRLCEREAGRALGGLDPGGPAGFLWTDKDPVEQPDTLERPRAVYLGSAWIKGPPSSSPNRSHNMDEP